MGESAHSAADALFYHSRGCVQIVTAAGATRTYDDLRASWTKRQELAFSTVTERRFCDQQEMSLQTATGRSLP